MARQVATETALVVAVPETPAALHEVRIRHDPSARLGLPDHIIVMYPFVGPDRLDSDVEGRLAVVLASVAAFDFQLTDVQWFAFPPIGRTTKIWGDSPGRLFTDGGDDEAME